MPPIDRRESRDHAEADDAAADRLARAAERAPRGFLREFAGFLAANKKWWLAPILVILFAVGALVLFGGTAAAPFIYTLF